MAINIPITTFGGNARGSSSGSAGNSTSTSRTYFAPEMKQLSEKYFDEGRGEVQSYADRLRSLSADRVGGIRSNYAEQLELLNRLGGTEQDRINRDFASQANSVGANLAGTGLYNTTVQGNMAQGVERNRQESLGALSEALRGQQLAALQGTGQQVSQAQGDDMQTQLALAQLLSGMYEQQGSYMPTLSESMSRSENASNSYQRAGNR
tara:strand:- start:3511 stop:4134 length:624 start_codon:yes stop_codon:yes gene_type:complete